MKAPPPPPPPKKNQERVVMKGKTLKEALEYTPGKPKDKFIALSREDRVKRLKQELADMENLMRTGIAGSGSLASGPSSAATDEYIPAAKKIKKSRKHRERPPPPPPPPRKEPAVLETSISRAPPPPPPPPKKPVAVEPTKPTLSDSAHDEVPATKIDEAAVSLPPASPVKNIEDSTEESSPKKKPLKKRILNEQYQTADPFDSFGAAAAPPPPPPGPR